MKFMFTMSFSPQLSEKESHFSGAYVVRKTFVYAVACQALLVAHVLIRNQYVSVRGGYSIRSYVLWG